MIMRVNFDIDPLPKPRMTRRDIWWQTDENARKCVVDYYAFKTKLNGQAKKLQFIVPDELTIIFYIPMPKSWSQKKRDEMRGKPHKQKPDWDNLAKAFTDSLSIQDEHIWSATVKKYWSDKGYIVVENVKPG